MTIIVALGSNLGDREQNLAQARLRMAQSVSILATSRIYQSTPVEYQDQPDFLNQVIEISENISFSPHELLNFLLDIEKKMGRTRVIKKGPRTIDLDLIFYSDHVIHDSELSIPHPAWMERDFILYPLSELPFWKNMQLDALFPSIHPNTAPSSCSPMSC